MHVARKDKVSIGDLVKPRFAYREEAVGLVIGLYTFENAPDLRVMWPNSSKPEWDWAEHLMVVSECK